MTQIRQSIFDLSFEKEGVYLVVLKCGLRIAYSKRSDVWLDKAKSQFVTLSGLIVEEGSDLEMVFDNFGDVFYCESEERVDIRYNDVSAVFEIHRGEMKTHML